MKNKWRPRINVSLRQIRAGNTGRNDMCGEPSKRKRNTETDLIVCDFLSNQFLEFRADIGQQADMLWSLRTEWSLSHLPQASELGKKEKRNRSLSSKALVDHCCFIAARICRKRSSSSRRADKINVRHIFETEVKNIWWATKKC